MSRYAVAGISLGLAVVLGIVVAIGANDTTQVTVGSGKTYNTVKFVSGNVIGESSICDATTENQCAAVTTNGLKVDPSGVAGATTDSPATIPTTGTVASEIALLKAIANGVTSAIPASTATIIIGAVGVTDGTNFATVKAASTPAVTTDKSLVVELNPHSAGIVANNSYTNIATATTTTVKSGTGVLHSICINTVNATSTAQIYDNTAGSGSKIGLITQATGQQPGCLIYDVSFTTGLTIVTTTGTPDYTVSWR